MRYHSRTVRRPLIALVLLSGCAQSIQPWDSWEDALHVDRMGQTDQYGRAHDVEPQVSTLEPKRKSTSGRFGSEIDHLQALVTKRWASKARHEALDAVDVDAVFDGLRKQAGSGAAPADYAKGVRRTLCHLGDAHLRLVDTSGGAQTHRSGLDLDVVSGAFVVTAVDERYKGGGRRPAVGDVVVKIDGKPTGEYTLKSCRVPGSTGVQRSLLAARSLAEQQRLPEERARPESITLERRKRTFSVGLKWRKTATRTAAKRPCVEGKKVSKRMGLLVVHSFDCPDATAFERDLQRALSPVRGLPNVALDLRGNAGGAPEQARALLRRFLADGVWTTSRAYDKTEFSNEMFAPGDGALLDAKLWVITGPGCAGTCELLAAALSTKPGVTIVGQTTAGATGDPKEHQLSTSNLVVTVPDTEYALPGTSVLIEGRGVEPHVEVHPTPQDIARGRDVALEEVVSRLDPP